jgi:hypothetical protein
MGKYLSLLLGLCILCGCYGVPTKPIPKNNAIESKSNKVEKISKSFARMIPGVGVTDDGTIVTVLTKLVPPAEYTGEKKLTSSDITMIMKDTCDTYLDFLFYEPEYATVKKEFLLNTFSKAYCKLLYGYQLNKWETKWDCDDFSNEFRGHAIKSNQKTSLDVAGIAVGVFCYKVDDGGYHAINVAITEDRKVVFIEPQTCQEVQLSYQEKKSAYAVIF